MITQSPRTTQGPALDGSPEWFLQGSFPDPIGRTAGINRQSLQRVQWKQTLGKVLGAIGNGMGIGHGQFIEASYWAMDKQGNLYAGTPASAGSRRWQLPSW